MKLLKKISISLFFIGGNIAFAASDVASLAEGWAGTILVIQILLLVLAGLVGLGMMASGAVQLKKHGENPQQNPLNKGLIFLASGAILFGLTATTETLQDTVFGEGGGSKTDDLTHEF